MDRLPGATLLMLHHLPVGLGLALSPLFTVFTVCFHQSWRVPVSDTQSYCWAEYLGAGSEGEVGLLLTRLCCDWTVL
jgi:hypothetical protein